jgi:hypothetical protein
MKEKKMSRKTGAGRIPVFGEFFSLLLVYFISSPSALIRGSTPLTTGVIRSFCLGAAASDAQGIVVDNRRVF